MSGIYSADAALERVAKYWQEAQDKIAAIEQRLSALTGEQDIESSLVALEAGRKPAIRDRDAAIRAAKAIWTDCLDRRGLKWEFEKIENSVRREIIGAWSQLIRQERAK